MGAGATLGELDNLRSFRPVRVLVAGRDARYARATTFLLGRSGYETRRVRHARALPADPRVEAADIVLLEDAASPDAVVAEAGELVSAFPHIAAVVAAGRRAPLADGRLQFVEKWAPFEEVVAAVNRAWASIGPASGHERWPDVEAARLTPRAVQG
jgi:hypothetical protein